MRIMLADDLKTMRDLLKNTLEQAGYSEFAEACDGPEALRKANTFRPQLIIVSGKLPTMDGVTFVKTCRERGYRMPVIMVASEADRSRVLEAIEAGVSSYIIKPFTPETLRQRVAEILARFEAA
jgi:two-component system chemotaxis response regulator CheY